MKRIREGADYEETKTLKPSSRNLYVVVPLGVKDYEEKPHIWDISKFLFQDMLDDEIEENQDLGVFPDLEEGLSVKIRFSEASIGKNKFAETSRIDFEQRDQQYGDDILKQVPDLDNVLNIMDYKSLEAKFLEVDDEGEVIDEPEKDKKEVPEPDRKKEGTMRRSFPPKKAEPEKEDNDEEEEEAPTPKKSSPAAGKGKGKCPFGFEFGADCEKHDECDACDLWDKCIDAKEGK